MIRVVVEERAGQHADLMTSLAPKFCECGGDAIAGNDACLYCGKYIESLFHPDPAADVVDIRTWQRFVRLRPHEEAA